jgi:hypothetical protein
MKIWLLVIELIVLAFIVMYLGDTTIDQNGFRMERPWLAVTSGIILFLLAVYYVKS